MRDSARAVPRQRAVSEIGFRWVMLGGVWLVYTSFGVISSSIAPLIGPMSADLGLSRSAMGSVLGAWQLIYLVTAIPCGMVIDRFGLRRSLAAGAFLIALSGVLRAVSVDFGSLFLAVAVFGVGGPLISIGAPKLLTVWFNRKDRGLAIGLYSTSFGIGSIAVLATANSVLMPLTGDSWRLTIGVYSAISLLAAVLWTLLARDPDRHSQAPAEAGAQGPSGVRAFTALLRVRPVQLVLLISIGSFLVNHGLNNWLPEILRAGGMTATQAGYWAAVPTLAGIIGALGIAKFAAPSRQVRLLIGLFLVTAISVALMSITSGAPMIFGMVLQGFVRAAITPVAMLILIDAPQVGVRNMGAAAGLYFTAGEIGGVLGPLLVGVLADQTGGFLAGLLMFVAVCSVLAGLAYVLGLTLRRPVQHTPAA